MRKYVESAILRVWVAFRLNFRLNGYVSCQYGPSDWGMVNGYTITLPLEVFTQINFVAADFMRLKLNFIFNHFLATIWRTLR